MNRIELETLLQSPTVSVETAGRVLGLAKNAAYRAARAGQIPALSFGGKARVPSERLRQMLGLPAAPVPVAAAILESPQVDKAT